MIIMYWPQSSIVPEKDLTILEVVAVCCLIFRNESASDKMVIFVTNF